MPRNSLAKSTALHLARTQTRRTITDSVPKGLIQALLVAAASYAITQLAKRKPDDSR